MLMKGAIVNLVVIYLFGVAFLRGISSAADLSTTNRDCLSHFWTVADETNRPVTVVSFGDSMADSCGSISFVMMNRLVQRFGIAGYSLNNYQNATLWYTEGEAELIPPGPFWFTYHGLLRPGGAMRWEKEWSSGGVRCDRAGVFYVSYPAGGLFNLLVSTNAGPWNLALTVDAQSETPQGQFAKVDLPLNLYRVRLEGISGTNYILGPQLLNRSSSGVHAVFADQGGISLGQVTRVPLAIRAPVFQELAPDLLVWHMKEGSDQATIDGLLECEQWWASAATNCDILYIGTPWASVDTNSSYTISQNSLVRSIALSHDRAYVDCMTPAVSYPWMVAQGYMVDATHLDRSGSTYLANIAWDDLGFFGLRCPRSLVISQAGASLKLDYTTAVGVNYALEHSYDSSTWEGISTNSGTGDILSKTITGTAPKEMFRLRLQP